jgi:hypothetical protein
MDDNDDESIPAEWYPKKKLNIIEHRAVSLLSSQPEPSSCGDGKVAWREVNEEIRQIMGHGSRVKSRLVTTFTFSIT